MKHIFFGLRKTSTNLTEFNIADCMWSHSAHTPLMATHVRPGHNDMPDCTTVPSLGWRKHVRCLVKTIKQLQGIEPEPPLNPLVPYPPRQRVFPSLPLPLLSLLMFFSFFQEITAVHFRWTGCAGVSDHICRGLLWNIRCAVLGRSGLPCRSQCAVREA